MESVQAWLILSKRLTGRGNCDSQYTKISLPDHCYTLCAPQSMFSSARFSSVANRLGRRGRGGGGERRDDVTEILFQSFLQEALVRSFGMGRDVHSLTLSIQHFLCWPRRRPPSEVPFRMVWERSSWHVVFPYRARVSPCSVSVASLRSCGPSCQLTSLRTQSLYSETKRQRTGFVVVVSTP